MTIPKFYEVMLPMLKFCSDNQEHTIRETLEVLGKRFDLTQEELSELIPSGYHTLFRDRIVWAKKYLKEAGLLSFPDKGKIKITERGVNVLKEKPLRIDVKFLEKYDEFQEFKQRWNKNKVNHKEIEEIKEEKTPQELLEISFAQINSSFAEELLEQVKKCSPRFFEKAVLKLLVAMGYGDSRMEFAELTPYSNDKGIDGIIREDSLGLDKIYVQAKRWTDETDR